MSRLLYSEQPPPTNLAALVDCYWSVIVEPDGIGTPSHWVLPDGCNTLSISMAPQMSVRFRRPALQPFRAPCVPGERLVGVRFRPGASSILHGEALVARLSREIEPGLRTADVIDLLQAILGDVFASSDGPDPRIERLVTSVRESAGLVPVGRMSEQAGLSERQLERLFQSNVGLGPKAFARISRLQAVVRRVLRPRRPPLAQIAAEFGYADQTHMTREFVQLGGLRPSAYIRMLADFQFSLGRMSDLY